MRSERKIYDGRHVVTVTCHNIDNALLQYSEEMIILVLMNDVLFYFYFIYECLGFHKRSKINSSGESSSGDAEK